MQCGLELIPLDADRSYKIKPSSDFPVATGRLCQKGLNSIEHTIHEERLHSPLRREDGIKNDLWKKASWEDAFSQISKKIIELQSKYGKDSIAVFGGGSLTNETCYLLGKFARVALGTRYIDYNGRFCMSSAAAASNKAFGIDRGLNMPLSNITEADYIILAGTNIAECQPTMMPYLLEAKKKGATIVCIDPRHTLTSKIATIPIRLRPGFDSLFVNGLLNVIIAENLQDHEFINSRTNGFEQVVELVRSYTPEKVEEITGILAPVIRTIARGFAQAKTGVILTARGIEQQVNGVENTLNYINLALVTGKIGKKGCGFGTITGQANGQGGREHGLKADQLPGYRSIEDPKAREYVASVWGIDEKELPGKGVSAYELFQKIENEEIKGLLVFGSNPIVSSPNNGLLHKAFKKLDLLVVTDLYVTETAEYADWVLAGASFLETEGTLTNLEGRTFYRPQAIEVREGCKTDIEIMSELASQLGKAQYFNYHSAEEVFQELCLASQGGKADYSGMSYARIKEHKGLFWPCTQEADQGVPLMFEGGFYHEDQKAVIIPVKPKFPAEPTDAEYPYVLTTGRLGNHYLSGSQTRRTLALDKKAPIPLAEVHPWLAKKLGLTLNSKIRLKNRRGSITLHVKITDSIHPRVIFVPFHWGGEHSINQLTSDQLDPTSRMPEFKICAVNAELAE